MTRDELIKKLEDTREAWVATDMAQEAAREAWVAAYKALFDFDMKAAK